MNRFVTRCADWYCRIFGTPTAFALSVFALAVWSAFIPILGWARWNSGPGLFGNTFESTGEWFFGLGTLLVAGAVSRKQGSHEEKLDESLARVEHVALTMSELLVRINRMEAEHGDQLAQILEAVHHVDGHKRAPTVPAFTGFPGTSEAVTDSEAGSAG